MAPLPGYHDPHGAVVRFLRDFLTWESVLAKVRESVEELLDDPVYGSPGYGFEYAGNVFGCYDAEVMDRYEIELFAPGSAFLASYEKAAYFEEVMYSREEMGGWMSIGVKHLSALLPDSADAFEESLRDFFSPEKQVSALVEKLQGYVPWAHGPLGGPGSVTLDAEEVERWWAFHRPGFHLAYTTT